MCGIAGAFGANWRYAYQSLELIRHRGPDGQAVVSFRGGYVGHTRLAIVDLEGGKQPIRSPAESTWLICNGEIYNHSQLRAKYEAYPFRTQSDSEDVLAVYSRHGDRTTHYLEGMYAFAIVNQDEVFLARDPLGIKPLYYGSSDQTFYFASEVKALQDIVAQVKEFPPGHWYSGKRGFVRYYDLQKVVQNRRREMPRTTHPSDIRSRLRQAVHTHLMADVPLGVFLSGGLDSSIIAALVKEEIPGLHSFCVGLEGSQDIAYARHVARYLGTRHHEYVYSPDEMKEALPEVIYYLESFDPALVRSALANYFLARFASQYVKVIHSGEGADELYSGYSYLQQFKKPDALQRELMEITGELHNRNLQRLDRMTMMHGLEGRVPFLDRQFVEFSLSISARQKLRSPRLVEKWALRKAFEDMLPTDVVWRTKQKFAAGAGSDRIFEQIASSEIADQQFNREAEHVFEETGHRIRSKEELYFYRIFRRFFKASTVPLVGFSRSL